MLKIIAKLIAVLAIAAGLGLWATDYTLNHFDGFDALEIGAWSAFPVAGTAEADPYTKARDAQNSYLRLGRAEGLAFHARTDSNGQNLKRNCTYRLTGFTPQARFWTLYPATADLQPIIPRDGLLPALHSRELIYDDNGNVNITIGPNPSMGNWLPIEGNDSFALVMTLYDTPAGSSAGLTEIVMPQLIKINSINDGGC